jgi:hypothetical protein
MTATERLAGFRPLKPGRIHLRCPHCRRKMSNMARADHDPPRAVVCELPCPKCSQGCKEPPSYYYDAEGEPVDFEEAVSG